MRPRKLKWLLLPLILTALTLWTWKFVLWGQHPATDEASKIGSDSYQVNSQATYYFASCDYHVVFNQDEINSICAPHPTGSPVCHVTHIDHLNHSDFRSARLNLPGRPGQSLAMFVHPAKDLISNSIVSTGGWEADGVGLIIRVLTALPGAALIDVGSNLGVYSLRVASELGRKVVSIDANYQNVIRLRKSVLANKLQDNVQIFWNALATDRGVLRMRVPGDCNIGGGMPTEVLQSHWLRDPVEVRTAGLDEIVVGREFLENVTDLVFKIDIEGAEWGAIATAVETFGHKRVPAVMMEWRGTQIFHPDKADFLLRFFASRNYTAYNFWGSRSVALSNVDQKNWPGDVLWVNQRGLGLLK